MGRKRKNSIIADARLTNCSVVVEILDEVFIPRYEPGFDNNWGNHSWHVATVKKDQGLPSEPNEKILDDSLTSDSSEVKQINKNKNSCDQCNFKTSNPKFLIRHMLSAHRVVSDSEGGSLDDNEFTAINDGDKSDNNTKTKQSKAKKLVLNKKASYKHRLKTKNTTLPNKKINLRSNASMEDKDDNNENKGMVSPVKRRKSDSVSMKKGKPALNVHNFLNEESRPLSDSSEAVINKKIISTPPKKIILDSPSISPKRMLNDEINECRNGEQKKTFSCTKKRSLNSDPIEKKKNHTIGQNISFNKTYDRQANKSPFSLAKKRSSDSDSTKVKKGSSDSQNNSNKRKSGSFKDGRRSASAKKRKLNFDSIETKKSMTNSFNENKFTSSSGRTNNTSHSPLKKKKLGSAETQKMTLNYEQAIRKSENNLLKEIKLPNTKSKAINKNSNLHKNQTQDEILNFRKRKSKTPIKKYIKSEETPTARESSDEDTTFYSFKKIIDEPQNESPNTTARKKQSYSPRINTDKLSKSDQKKRVSFKEVNDEEQSVTLKIKSEFAMNETPRLPRKLSYPLGCQYCHFRCKNDWVMQKHTLVIHNNGKHFSCKLCNYTTKVMGSFQIHHLIHSNVKPLKCYECDYKTNNTSNLNNHKKCHSDLRPFKCNECSYTAKSNCHLKSHKLVHTDYKRYSCMQCDYKCKTSDRMKLHIQSHSKIKHIKCDQCDYSCKFQNNLKRHMYIHTNERAFSCDSCDKTFKTKPLLKNHTLVHQYVKPYICKKCNFKCNTVQDLKKHFKGHSVVDSKTSLTPQLNSSYLFSNFK